MYDLVIVGAGPAGLSAAIYAARAELDFLVLEKELMSGGQIVNTAEVDNYPGLRGMGGFDLAMKFREHADALGVRFATGNVVRMEEVGPDASGDGQRTERGKRLVCADGSVYEARTVLLSGGAKHRPLGVPGEERLSGMGVSYCATCDGAFFKGKEVAVVGGGDVAVEDAWFLSRLCQRVTLIHRRDTLRAAKTLVSRLTAAENVELRYDSVVEEIQGRDRVERLLVRDKRSGKTTELAADGVFIAVGMLPETGWLSGAVKTDAAGYVVADETCVTSDPAVFAAGDIRTKQLRQVVTAAADGANAIGSIERYLAG